MRKVRAQGVEVGPELGWALIMDAPQPKATGAFDVSLDVIHKGSIFRLDAKRLQGFTENKRRGLARMDVARVGAGGLGEKTKEIKCGFEMRNVNGIGIGEKPETKPLSKRFEQRIVLQGFCIESGIPGVPELFECE